MAPTLAAQFLGNAARISSVNNGARVTAATKKIAPKTVKKVGTVKKAVTRKVAPKTVKRTAPKRGAAKKAPPKGFTRGLWYPGAVPPPYLDGSLPGDRGCDPFGLGAPVEYLQYSIDELDQNKAVQRAGDAVGSFKAKKSTVDDAALQPYNEVFNIQRFRECELLHGRWAMLAMVGAPSVEAATGVSWVDAGLVELEQPQYLGRPIDVSLSTLVAIEVLLFAVLEVARNQIVDPEQRCYPGGAFDPFGLAEKGNTFALKESELKHARLAMVGNLVLVAEWAATGKGAIGSLSELF
mmetsp:Transcript_5434/g.19873  ORF Transcript_5434/g.19873 Transcript_5434/m.19873 type:complete len:295 (-) Transcript_5434:144-1028(-)